MKKNSQTADSKNSILNFRLAENFTAYPALNQIVFEHGKNRETVKLEPRVMRVLTLLAAQPGEVLEREFLIDQVWHNKYVGEEALTQAISRLRKVFRQHKKYSEIIETIPKKGYRLAQPVDFFSLNDPLVLSDPQKVSENEKKSDKKNVRDALNGKLILLTGLFTLVVVLIVFFIENVKSVPEPLLLDAVAVTSDPGVEFRPSLSPHGDFVAFSKQNPANGSLDVFVKGLTNQEIRQLTNNDADNTNTVWSPDGRFIAFAQLKNGYSDLRLISATGGESRRLVGCGLETKPTLDWHPKDGQIALSDRLTSTAPYRIYLIDTVTLERTPLTNPPSTFFGDLNPVFSADGKELAFKRMYTATTGDIYTINLNEGKPFRVTRDAEWIGDIGWLDRNTIIFSSSKGSFRSAWKVSCRGGKQVWLGGEGIYELAVSKAGKTLAFSKAEQNIDIWGFPIESKNQGHEKPIQILTSTKIEWSPTVSPSGNQIAYLSNESGHFEVWLSNVDGTEKKMLTNLKKKVVGNLSWTLDGNLIAFSVVEDRKYFIMAVPAAGGLPTTLIKDRFNSRYPTWSRDGRFLYFSSDRKKGWQIWKKNISDDSIHQMTFEGGSFAQESWHGSHFYFTRPGLCGIWKMPTKGSKAELVFQQVVKSDFNRWQLIDTGIYFIERQREPHTISFFDFSKNVITPIMLLPKNEIMFSVSEKMLYYPKIIQSESDIMLVRL